MTTMGCFTLKDKCEKQQKQLKLYFLNKVWIFYEFFMSAIQLTPKESLDYPKNQQKIFHNGYLIHLN